MTQVLDSAEEHLNTAVVDLKGVLGEGCPWVGPVVRRLAGLHHIKGDAIMAEGLYGGGLGRVEAMRYQRRNLNFLSNMMDFVF